MVMRAMLIGLLVIGAVAMLETDVSACRLCGNVPCCWLPGEMQGLLEEVKKCENCQVYIVGETDDDLLKPSRVDVRDMLIRHGLRPGNIGELIYKDRALPRYSREGQMVIVVQPK